MCCSPSHPFSSVNRMWRNNNSNNSLSWSLFFTNKNNKRQAVWEKKVISKRLSFVFSWAEWLNLVNTTTSAVHHFWLSVSAVKSPFSPSDLHGHHRHRHHFHCCYCCIANFNQHSQCQQLSSQSWSHSLTWNKPPIIAAGRIEDILFPELYLIRFWLRIHRVCGGWGCGGSQTSHHLATIQNGWWCWSVQTINWITAYFNLLIGSGPVMMVGVEVLQSYYSSFLALFPSRRLIGNRLNYRQPIKWPINYFLLISHCFTGTDLVSFAKFHENCHGPMFSRIFRLCTAAAAAAVGN